MEDYVEAPAAVEVDERHIARHLLIAVLAKIGPDTPTDYDGKHKERKDYFEKHQKLI